MQIRLPTKLCLGPISNEDALDPTAIVERPDRVTVLLADTESCHVFLWKGAQGEESVIVLAILSFVFGLRR